MALRNRELHARNDDDDDEYVECIVYADDIILSCTIHGLQHMLNTCYEIAANLKLVFNSNKLKYITFGPGCKLDISDMYLGTSTIKCSL